jgi:hypothetical protein
VSIAEHVGIAIGVDFSMRLLQSERCAISPARSA